MIGFVGLWIAGGLLAIFVVHLITRGRKQWCRSGNASSATPWSSPRSVTPSGAGWTRKSGWT